MSAPIMGHLVIGNPTLEASFATACQYAEAGLRDLEVQIPFSHPTADGPVITQANTVAIANGITLADSLAFIRRLKDRYPSARIMAMTYANKAFAHGLDRLMQDLATAGAEYLILPDLSYDSPLAAPLRTPGPVSLVPVLGANVPDERLHAVLAHGPRFVYLMAGYQLTGSSFALDGRIGTIAAQIRKAGAEVGVGFGIDSRAAVEAALAVADVAIVGSALLRAQAAGTLAEKLAELTGSAVLTS